MKSLWKNYSLSIVLLFLFLGSWVLHAVFQWQEFTSVQKEHGEEVTIEGFMPEFMASTFENWQSEFLQLLTFAILTSFLVHKGSPESSDSDKKTEKMLTKIDKKISLLSRKS